MLDSQSSAHYNAEEALEKFLAIMVFLNIDHFIDYNMKLKFKHFFNTCPTSIQQKLCTVDIESFKEQFRKINAVSAQNIGNYFKQEIQNNLISSHEVFNLYEILLQSTDAFFLAQKIREFIFTPSTTPSNASDQYQFRHQIKQTLEEKSGWNVEAGHEQKIKSLKAQQTLMMDYKQAVIHYREKASESFWLDHLYRRKFGTYSLDNFLVFLQESGYVPEDHIKEKNLK